jgi:hypothetical protein
MAQKNRRDRRRNRSSGPQVNVNANRAAWRRKRIPVSCEQAWGPDRKE